MEDYTVQRQSNLPLHLTPLIGREQEVTELSTLLRRPQTRLLTLTGPGGIGKTSLALQVARELLIDFIDGVCFIPLAAIRNPELVLPTAVQMLGLREVQAQSPLDHLKTYLHEKNLLLFLDNFEQVIEVAPLLTALLETCLSLKILVTSREVLHVRGEWEHLVPPLALPDLKHLPDHETLTQYAAVALFVQRTRYVKPDFQVTEANAATIVAICTCLDGLPLALELAAARLKQLSLQALLARLGHRFEVLTQGPRDVHTRQQTLRNTIQWSYDLLTPEEQYLLRRLTVFVGGWTLEAAEAVCQTHNEKQVNVFDGIASLLDKSLLYQKEQPDGEQRLFMLETIREYGWECLVANEEAEVSQRAHTDYYLRLAESAEPELGRPQQMVWLERLEREHDNLRAAMHWLVELVEAQKAGPSREMAWRLGDALQWFWERRGHFKEGRNFLERVLAGSEREVVLGRAKALNAAGMLASFQGDYARRDVLCTESLVLFRKLGDRQGIAFSLFWLAFGASERGNHGEGRSMLKEAMELHKEVGNMEYVAWSLFRLAQPDLYQGEYTRARALREESLRIHKKLGNTWGIAYTLTGLAGVLFYSQGDPTMVHTLLEEGLTLYRELGYKERIAHSLFFRGEIALSRGDTALARALAEESLALYKEIEYPHPIIMHSYEGMSPDILAEADAIEGNYGAARVRYEEGLALAKEMDVKGSIAIYLEGLAHVVALQGDPSRAAHLWGEAEALRQVCGMLIPPVYRSNYEQAVAAARTQLGEKAFATAWAQGSTITPAPTSAAQPTTTKSHPIYPAGLTKREMDVLRLLAQGLTDTQIAEQLVLSRRTVNWYLTSIYSKIQVSSRSAATRYAFEHQLV
jgi:predicted ATPase/DNA-binding CsgD family transcriptional regulator